MQSIQFNKDYELQRQWQWGMPELRYMAKSVSQNGQVTEEARFAHTHVRTGSGEGGMDREIWESHK